MSLELAAHHAQVELRVGANQVKGIYEILFLLRSHIEP